MHDRLALAFDSKVRDRLGFLKEEIDRELLAVTAEISSDELRAKIQCAISGGKRVRPILTLLSCEAVGGRWSDALSAAVAVELLHCSSLVHDDIMDQSSLRRGRETLFARFGTSFAILAGDLLVALSYRMIDRVPMLLQGGVLHELTDAFADLCEGQHDDLRYSAQSRCDDSPCEKVLLLKTARLFEVATSAGAQLGTADDRLRAALTLFGRHLGMAYQVVDDTIDALGDEEVAGKSVGQDSRNDRRTIILSLSRSQTSPAVLVDKYTNAARKALEVLPQTGAKDQLISLACLLAQRRS
jgi:geranylgeranyl pyrophosphate synthase